MRSISSKLALVLAVIPLAHASAQTLRDSAGVRIVENTQPVLAATRAWRLALTPTVDIGTTSGDSVYEFQRVMGVLRLRDGRIAVGNQGSGTIRFFDSTGKYLSAAGRPGRGPGEFQQILALHRLRGDTLLVVDNQAARLFGSDGKFVRDGASRASGRSFIWPFAVFEDGSYVGTGSSSPSSDRSGEWIDSVTAFRVSSDGSRVDSIARVPGSRQISVAGSRYPRRVIFGPRSYWASAGDGFYRGFGERYSIGFYSPTGSLQRVVRRAVAKRPVPAKAVEDYKTYSLNAGGEDGRPWPPQMRERLRGILESTRFADAYPAFANFAVDRTGHLWVSHYEPWVEMLRPGPASVRTSDGPTEWDIFDPQGRWLCTVGLPASFAPLDIGADYVAGLWRDADDVEHVRLYRLLKP